MGFYAGVAIIYSESVCGCMCAISNPSATPSLWFPPDSHSDCVRSSGHKLGGPVPQEPDTAPASLCAEDGRSATRLLHGENQRIPQRIDRVPGYTEVRRVAEEDKGEEIRDEEVT